MKTKGIEKFRLLKKSSLNQKFYFASLMAEAYRQGLLSEATIEKIQMECIALLAGKTQQYTHGESSSVRIEIAESMMESNLYTISLYLKSFPFPDDAVQALTQESISDIYQKGRQIIESKLKSARYWHKTVLNNLLAIDNEIYNSTIIDGIKGFFKIYDADYQAQEIRITADYPLIKPIENLVGIEFIERYLESLNCENNFCQYFDPQKIASLLWAYDNNYQDLIFNLFEQVLTCALACLMAETNLLNLHLTNMDIEQISALLSNKSKEQITTIITKAYYQLLRQLAITDHSLQQYLKKALSPIIVNICNALAVHKPEKVFIEGKSSATKPQIYFSLGDKMENEQYRDILYKIKQCLLTKDKIAIIKNQVQALADLEDIFFDAYLSPQEISLILQELDITEIATLAKRHPAANDLETIGLSEEEIVFRLCLKEYIQSLSQEKQILITQAIELINYENN